MARILIVDDEDYIRDLLSRLLARYGHDCDVAACAADAFLLVSAAMAPGGTEYDLIMSDIRMPGQNGLDFLDDIMDLVESTTPCIVITGSTEVENAIRAIEVRASGFLRKPWELPDLARTVERGLRMRERLKFEREYQGELERRVADALAAEKAAMERERAAMAREKATYDATIAGFASLLEDKDTTTADHCERVRAMCSMVGRSMGLDGDALQALELGAMLHDIGKFKIPDRILNKAGKLDDAEWVVMRTHPTIGGDLCDKIGFLKGAGEVVRNHHEKWNGTGYPRGLQGDAIPLSARIFMVVDAYDTITSRRSYKEPQSHDQAVAEIRRCAGAHFDPQVVDVFLRLAPEIEVMLRTSLANRRDAFAGKALPVPQAAPSTPHFTPAPAVPVAGRGVRAAS